MRKLLFFSIAMSLLLNTKAQTETRKLESVPTQKQSIIEKKMDVLFAPINEAGGLSNYYYSTPVRKSVTYKDFGTVSNVDFAENDRGAGSLSNWTDKLINLFPDSLAATYDYDQNGDSYFKAEAWVSTGFTFDPYSKGFDPFFQYGLFEDKGGKYYGYRLDTLSLYAFYRMPNGYNAASPDVLRLYVTHFPYPDTTISWLYNDYLRYEDGINMLTPRFVYPSPILDKGVGPIMKSTEKRIVDYKLDDKDSANVGPGHVGLREINVPIQGGFEVPAGHVLSIVVQYIPGFDNYDSVDIVNIAPRTYEFENDTLFKANDVFYVGNDSVVFENDTLIFVDDTCFSASGDGLTLTISGETIIFPNDTCFDANNILIFGYDTSYYRYDTLSKVIWNTSLPTGSQYVDEDIRMNTFAIPCWDMTNEDMEDLYDSRGFNTSFIETQNIRYNNPQNEMDSFCVDLTTYCAFYYITSAFWMSLSVDEDFDPNNDIPNYGQELISQIYPNPATTRLTVDLNEADKANVTIYNILGQAVIEETLHGISNSINIAELSSGLYFVKVTQNGRSHTVKISKE